MLTPVGLFLLVLLAQSVSAGHWAEANRQCLNINDQGTSYKWGQMFGGLDKPARRLPLRRE